MPPSIHEKTVEVGGRSLTFETGRLAGLASGSVSVSYGDTLVLSAAVGAKEPREGLDFFPLTVDYEEKMYAAGKIPGGFIKREGRPNESAILAARLTDRPVRPLFPKGYRSEVQIISTVLSTDQENEPDILAINGASAALTLSDIPWSGPIGAVRIGDIDGELVVNPTFHQLIDSKLDVVVAGTANGVMMVEGEANGIPEERLLAAVELAHNVIKRLVQAQVELRDLAGKPKREFVPPAENSELKEQISAFLGGRLDDALFNADKEQRLQATATLKSGVVEHFTTVTDSEAGKVIPSAKEVAGVFGSLVKEKVRASILERGERPDGRKPQEIRDIWSQVGYLPRTHGSAIFTRGQTQVITVTTLGTISEGQHLDGIGVEESKRYLHHYNFPPFSVGETKPLRGPSRRDIGHGALAERSLRAVLPDEDTFPYTLRLVSEVVSSNGSSSMASVCGSTMSLMDAGVPITAPVAGVAMGLVTDSETGRHTVLTDIQGIEDALGDMDFKVAGTETGITGIQMDIKVQGITAEIMREALEQARQGRLFILGKMAETIDQPRAEMSPFAPRVIRLQINPSQIGAVIGPGGKIIRGIQEATGAKLDIEDDGSVFISAVDEESARRAVTEVEKLTRIPLVGDKFTGRVKTIIGSGAFVEILPGKDGFVHISELEPRRVESVEDSVQVGQEVDVVITAIRPDGKINLSRKALMTGNLPEPGAAPAGGGQPNSGGGRPPYGGERRNNDRPPRGDSEHRGGPAPREPFREPRSESPSSEGDQLVRRPRDSRVPPRRDGD